MPEIDSINFDTIYSFIKEDISTIDDLKILKKYKILINSTTGEYFNKKWSFFDCMYASVTLNDKHYVLNEGNIYEIKKEFHDNYQNQYKKINIFSPLPNGVKNQKEREYLEEVCLTNPNFILVDSKLIYKDRGAFEPCDIFNIDEKNFIHIKRYGSSKILSHLFAQAAVSADLFMNSIIRNDIIKKIESLSSSELIKSLDFKDCKVTIAIITEKPIPDDGLVKIPFFSMVNVVRTINQILSWGYKDVGLMFIKAD